MQREAYNVKQLLLAGGVVANKGLRARLEEEFAQKENIELIIPPLSLCTDNAMIARQGQLLMNKVSVQH